MSYTFLDNAAPEHPFDSSRRISPILTPDGQPRVRVEFGGAPGQPSDYFPNAARDVAAALVAHANEAEQMAANLANEKARAEAAKRKAEAEALRAILAAKPHPRAERTHPNAFPKFWIWCDDDGQFWYSYGHGRCKFTPGVSFTGEPNFAPTPTNRSRWDRLWREASEAKRLKDAEAAEAKRKAEAKAKAALPHPRAVVVSKPGVFPQYRIWCDDDGLFWYDWEGSVFPPTKFIPGKEFQQTDAFKATPENVALWIKLAAEAAYEDARSW